MQSNASGKHGKTAIDPERRWTAKWKLGRNKVCMEWTGKLNKAHRGTFWDGNVQVDAQKYAWFREHGSYPERPLTTRCATLCCVNPSHLVEMTVKKPSQSQRNLRDKDVQAIRQMYEERNMMIKEIAKNRRFYKASEASVYLAAKRKTYLSVPDEHIDLEAEGYL